MDFLDLYGNLQGQEVIGQLQRIAKPLEGKKIVHVNSTAVGGGVAEILETMVPFLNHLGIPTSWKVIHGSDDFFACTKVFHNALQGKKDLKLDPRLIAEYEEVNRVNAEELRAELEEADYVFIHDPQPLPLISHMPKRKGKWVWRCHIDASDPNRSIWNYLRKYINHYDASIFHLAEFSRPLPHPIFLIPPSINAFSQKNIELPKEEIKNIVEGFQIDLNRPMILQVSRFDHFKDPWGVIEAFKLAKIYKPDLQLVLAGGGASDDPEGAAILTSIQHIASEDKNIHVLFLPSDANRTINALQRAATVVLQKSIKEGFGLTITEGLWKSKPVIGGNTGGIKLQIFNGKTGFLVNSPEGAANRIRYFLEYPNETERMGKIGHLFVKEHFLMTRHLRDYLILLLTLSQESTSSIELS